MKFSVTVKQKLGDETTKECSVYNGATLVEKVSFIAGADVNEAANLVEAMKDSKYLSAELVSGASGIMQTVAQQALAGGSAPAVTTEDYSNAVLMHSKLMLGMYWCLIQSKKMLKH